MLDVRSDPGGGWQVRPSRWVGAARVGALEVHVAPKVPIGRLLFLLGYLADPRAWREDAVSFDIPEGTQYLYFVVLGAPESYQVHVWDNDEATDAQMPFEIRLEWGK